MFFVQTRGINLDLPAARNGHGSGLKGVVLGIFTQWGVMRRSKKIGPFFSFLWNFCKVGVKQFGGLFSFSQNFGQFICNFESFVVLIWNFYGCTSHHQPFKIFMIGGQFKVHDVGTLTPYPLCPSLAVAHYYNYEGFGAYICSFYHPNLLKFHITETKWINKNRNNYAQVCSWVSKNFLLSYSRSIFLAKKC